MPKAPRGGMAPRLRLPLLLLAAAAVLAPQALGHTLTAHDLSGAPPVVAQLEARRGAFRIRDSARPRPGAEHQIQDG